MNHLLILFSLVLLGSCQSPIFGQKQYSTPYSGLDVISNTGLQSSLVSFCQNLIWSKSNNQIWFTADEATPNIHIAEFDPQGGNHSFWLWTKSPAPMGQAPPFVSLALSPSGDSLIGSAFPTAGNYQGLVLQSVFNSTWTVTTTYLEGYEFFGVTYGKATTSGVPGTFVYVAGWVNVNGNATNPSKAGFVVARGRLPNAGGPITIQPEDISNPLFQHGCYDIFTENSKPALYQLDNMLVVIVPGRCQTIIRFTLPDVDSTPFANIKPELLTQGQFGSTYIVASTWDAATGNIFFATREFNLPDTELLFVNGKAATLRVTASIKMATGESSVQLTAGAQGPKNYVYVASPLQGLVTQLEVDTVQGTFQPTGFANIPQELNKATSFIYINTFLYFTTYEPSCKIARLPFYNFCPYFCQDNAYCDGGICTCLPNYSPIWDGSKFAGCELTTIHEEIIKEQQIVGTAAVMGVLFVITAIVAFFGWRAWYASKNSSQSAALVHEYNRPL